MSATSGSAAAFRERVLKASQSLAVELFSRMRLDAGELARLQTWRLRELLAHTRDCSPFYARRLRGVDVERFELADLPQLAPVTKRELMAELDLVFTDRRLSRALAERALADTAKDVVPLFDEYFAQATGGSSGERGVFVSDAATWAEVMGGIGRHLIAHAPQDTRVAMVAAASPVHSTGLSSALNEPGKSPLTIFSVPVTLPLPELCARLVELQPERLVGYPTVLARLAQERSCGRLRIAPRSVATTSEMLTPELRAEIRAGFAVPLVDVFGSTEGLMGGTDPDGDVFSFNSDTCLAELVDADDRPVAPGVASDHILITNLANRVQPLIRYRIEDRFTRHPDSPCHGRLRASVAGRTGESLRWGAVEVHPLVVRGALLKHGEVLDYQVRQTRTGIDVSVVGARADERALAEELRTALAAAGLREPVVQVARTESLARDRATGKLRRFVPLV